VSWCGDGNVTGGRPAGEKKEKDEHQDQRKHEHMQNKDGPTDGGGTDLPRQRSKLSVRGSSNVGVGTLARYGGREKGH